jgi:hypothetical protein
MTRPTLAAVAALAGAVAATYALALYELVAQQHDRAHLAPVRRRDDDCRCATGATVYPLLRKVRP